jgi:hypothetical protein
MLWVASFDMSMTPDRVALSFTVCARDFVCCIVQSYSWAVPDESRSRRHVGEDGSGSVVSASTVAPFTFRTDGAVDPRRDSFRSD